MKPEHIVNTLLENDMQGPPVPDKFLGAVVSMRDLRALHAQSAKKMIQADSALQLERQLRKHGVTREQVASYILAAQKYPQNYTQHYGNTPQFNRPLRRGTFPPDAIVGMNLNDGREIIFDMAIIPEK